MQETIFHTLITNRLKDLGLSAVTAERKFDLPESSLRNLLREPTEKELKEKTKTRKRLPRLDTAIQICQALGLEFYIGPPRQIAPQVVTEIDGAQFATVARYDAQASAGGGVVNFDGPPLDYLAFSNDFLTRAKIDPTQAILIGVKGQSMQPTLFEGDLIMLDRRRTRMINNRVFAFNDGDETRVKRLEMLGEVLLIKSDNPDYATEAKTGRDINQITNAIIGEVIWSGHKWG